MTIQTTIKRPAVAIVNRQEVEQMSTDRLWHIVGKMSVGTEVGANTVTWAKAELKRRGFRVGL